jgi:hypothetical protein
LDAEEAKAIGLVHGIHEATADDERETPVRGEPRLAIVNGLAAAMREAWASGTCPPIVGLPSYYREAIMDELRYGR